MARTHRHEDFGLGDQPITKAGTEHRNIIAVLRPEVEIARFGIVSPGARDERIEGGKVGGAGGDEDHPACLARIRRRAARRKAAALTSWADRPHRRTPAAPPARTARSAPHRLGILSCQRY